MRIRNRIVAITMIMCILAAGSCMTTVAASGTYSVKVRASQIYKDAWTVLKLINKERSKRGLRKLELDGSLTDAAVQRGAEIAIAVPWSSPHRRPNGELVSTLDSRIIYECCAEGDITPESVVEGWMDSPSHKTGILLQSAQTVGIGCVISNGYRYWTMEFSSSGLKKPEKRKGVTTYNKEVVMVSSLMKKKYFKLGQSEDYIDYRTGRNGTLPLGKSTVMKAMYSGKDSVSGWYARLSPSMMKWKSSNPSVVSIDKDGTIKARKVGTATISATMKTSPKYVITKKVRVTRSEY